MKIVRIFTYLNGPSRIILRNTLMEKNKYINNITRMSSVDHKDIAHFNTLKETWWNENGPMSQLHIYNPIRMQFVREGLANTGFKSQDSSLPLQGINIVDVGCGGGIFSEHLARAGAQVTGIDASTEMIKIAKEHVKSQQKISGRITYLDTAIEEFSPKNEDSYDAVVLSEILEHVNEPALFLKECIRIVRPEGSIFITTPNKTLASWFLFIVVAEYMGYVPRDTHDWNKFIPLDEIQRMLENYGCKTRLIHGTYCNPITRRWFFMSDTSLHYVIHAIKQKN